MVCASSLELSLSISLVLSSFKSDIVFQLPEAVTLGTITFHLDPVSSSLLQVLSNSLTMDFITVLTFFPHSSAKQTFNHT